MIGVVQRMRGDNLAQPVLKAIQIGFLLIGFALWAMARLQPEEFDVNMYGKFALRYPAEYWAALIVCGAAMSLVGLQHPVKRYMVVIGGLISALTFIALGFSSVVTGGELIIGVVCNVLFAPLYLWMTLEAVANANLFRNR